MMTRTGGGRGKIIFLAVGLVSALCAAWALRHAVLDSVARFLVVNEPAERVDAAVTRVPADKAAECYRKKQCGRVIVIQIDDNAAQWKFSRQAEEDDKTLQVARSQGIAEGDLEVMRFPKNTAADFYRQLQDRLRVAGVRSAVVYATYFKTRRFRFMLDRVGADSGPRFYVQTVTDAYDGQLARWWENTMLDNLFLDEYLRMSFYYFQKLIFAADMPPIRDPLDSSFGGGVTVAPRPIRLP